MWLRKKARSPYWYAEWKHPDGSGRDVCASTRCVGKREAKAKGADLESAHRQDWARRQGGYGATVGFVIAQHWDAEVKHKRHAGSVQPHLLRIEHLVGADRPYSLVATKDVAAVVDVLRGVLSPATINRLLAAWRHMHNQAHLARGIPVQTIDWRRLMQVEPAGRTRNLTQAQVQSLLQRLPQAAAQIVAFAVLTGARKAQVLGLTWDRVDLQAGTAQIWKKHRRAMTPHTLHLHPVAMKILAERGRSRPAPNAASALVFNVVNFRAHWEAAVRDEGLADVRFHDLRHTAATWHVKNGTPLIIVKELLGHGDISTTMRYAHVGTEDVRSRALALPVAIETEQE